MSSLIGELQSAVEEVKRRANEDLDKAYELQLRASEQALQASSPAGLKATVDTQCGLLREMVRVDDPAPDGLPEGALALLEQLNAEADVAVGRLLQHLMTLLLPDRHWSVLDELKTRCSEMLELAEARVQENARNFRERDCKQVCLTFADDWMLFGRKAVDSLKSELESARDNLRFSSDDQQAAEVVQGKVEALKVAVEQARVALLTKLREDLHEFRRPYAKSDVADLADFEAARRSALNGAAALLLNTAAKDAQHPLSKLKAC